jgi:hypothetical protein
MVDVGLITRTEFEGCVVFATMALVNALENARKGKVFKLEIDRVIDAHIH